MEKLEDLDVHNRAALMVNNMTVSHKIKHRISFLFSNSTSGYIEKEI
jgi:hypothetical protein